MQEIMKAEAEEALGRSITDSMFAEALSCAKRKQQHIYQSEGREVVLQRWYLLKLAEEYVGNLAFSKFTMDLCRETCNMEKERLEDRHSPKTAIL